MGKRLSDGLSSKYFEAANRLNSRKARRRIVAYVESYDDVFFWRTVLGRFETDKVFFEVMLPTRSRFLERGKKAALMNLLGGKVGRDMIACVDADYDYLLQGTTEVSRQVNENPYVFHTYAYAIENLQCYAPSLHEVCVAVTLNDHEIFDIEGFLKEYSEIIFPLFVWNVWHYYNGTYSSFKITDFLKVIETGNLNIANAGEILGRLRHKVNRKAADLQRMNPGSKDSYHQVIERLKSLGVTPETTYLYIQGHHLFDKLIVPMLKKICERLVRERENEIRRQSLHGTQMRNELSCYEHSVGDITTILKKNNGCRDSEPYKRILHDVEKFMNDKRNKEEDDA